MAPPHYAAFEPTDLPARTVNLLLESGADPNVLNGLGSSPLDLSVGEGLNATA